MFQDTYKNLVCNKMQMLHDMKQFISFSVLEENEHFCSSLPLPLVYGRPLIAAYWNLPIPMKRQLSKIATWNLIILFSFERVTSNDLLNETNT